MNLFKNVASNKSKSIFGGDSGRGGIFGQKVHHQPRQNSEDFVDYSNINYVFKDDLDIVNIDTNIKKILSNRHKEIDYYCTMFDEQISLLEDSSMSIIKYKYVIGELCQLVDIIRDLETTDKLNLYIKESEKLISKYRELGPLEKVVSITSTDFAGSGKDEDNYYYRIKIIKDFLNVAKKYVPISFHEDTSIGDNVCDRCGVKRNFETTDIGMTYCTVCYHERKVLTVSQFRKENEEESGAFIPMDIDNTFYKEVMRVQGKRVIVPENVVKSIEDKLAELGCSPSSVIKKTPLDSNGRKPGTSRNLMIQAINLSGNGDFLKDWMILCNEIWGWSLPEFNDLEDVLICKYNNGEDIKPCDIISRYIDMVE